MHFSVCLSKLHALEQFTFICSLLVQCICLPQFLLPSQSQAQVRLNCIPYNERTAIIEISHFPIAISFALNKFVKRLYANKFFVCSRNTRHRSAWGKKSYNQVYMKSCLHVSKLQEDRGDIDKCYKTIYRPCWYLQPMNASHCDQI